MFIAAVPPGIARRLLTDTRTHRPVVLGGFRRRALPGGRELRACLESRVDAKLAAAARQTESTETVTRRDVIAGQQRPPVLEAGQSCHWDLFVGLRLFLYVFTSCVLFNLK